MLDLSALEEPKPTGVAAGKPLEILIEDIEEDPQQPRKEFHQESMLEIAASISERGVLQPVSVRPHPDKPWKWILNFGARRLRGSIMARKTSIPAFVDETNDGGDYDQVIENEQRANLSPMELALFIQRKLDEGASKGEIAKRLGKNRSIITRHLALINPPPCIEKIYRDGCGDATAVYELRRAWENNPEQVEAWCTSKSGDEITRKAVTELATTLKRGTGAPTSNDKKQEKPENKSTAAAAQNTTPTETKETSWPKGKVAQDPSSLKKPILIVEHNGHGAIVLLNRQPSSTGRIVIRYRETEEITEIQAGDCKIIELTGEIY